MTNCPDGKKFNDALKRALSMPPAPHKPLGKKAPKKRAAKKKAKPSGRRDDAERRVY